MTTHILEVEVNAERQTLAILSPTDANGNTCGGFRIAGPKAWGGSRNIARLSISTSDLTRYIKDYAPDVLAELGCSSDTDGVKQ